MSVCLYVPTYIRNLVCATPPTPVRGFKLILTHLKLELNLTALYVAGTSLLLYLTLSALFEHDQLFTQNRQKSNAKKNLSRNFTFCVYTLV